MKRKPKTYVCISGNILLKIHKFPPLFLMEKQVPEDMEKSISTASSLVEPPWWPLT